MDLSYSLRLREGGSRRIDLLRDAVSELLDARGIEWALLSFRDLGDFRVHVPFTEEAARVRAALPTLPDGRLSPIREAVGWAGEYLVDHARSPRRALVLVSDGIGTGGTSFAAAVGKGFADEGVALFVLGVDHKDNPAHPRGPRSRRPRDRRRLLCPPARRRPGAGAGPAAGAAAGRRRRPPRGPPGSRRSMSAPPRRQAPGSTLPPLEPWLLGGGAAGLALFALLRAIWRRADARREVPRRLRLIVGLWVTHSDGRSERLQFERPPVRVGAGADARIVVPGAGRTGFAIAWDREHAWLEAATPVIVNGVAQRRRVLKTNDRIALAGTRIIYRGMTEIEERDETPAPRRPDLMPLAAASAIVLVLGCVFAAARMVSARRAGRGVARGAPGRRCARGAPAAEAPQGTVRPQAAAAAAAAEEPLRHEAPRRPCRGRSRRRWPLHRRRPRPRGPCRRPRPPRSPPPARLLPRRSRRARCRARR